MTKAKPSKEKPVKDPLVTGPVKKSRGNKQDDELRLLARRKQVAQMYCEGKSQFEIADRFKISQVMVSYDLKKIRDAWLATAILDWDDVKAKELAKLDLIEERMWEAYHRSYGTDEIKTLNIKKELKRCQTENVGRNHKDPLPPPGHRDWNSDIDGPRFGADEVEDDELVVTEETVNTRSRQLPGDPAFMDRILDCIKLRCKLLGFLDDKNSNSGQQVGQIDWDAIAMIRVAPDPIEDKINKVLILRATDATVPPPSPPVDGDSAVRKPTVLVPVKTAPSSSNGETDEVSDSKGGSE